MLAESFGSVGAATLIILKSLTLTAPVPAGTKTTELLLSLSTDTVTEPVFATILSTDNVPVTSTFSSNSVSSDIDITPSSVLEEIVPTATSPVKLASVPSVPFSKTFTPLVE